MEPGQREKGFQILYYAEQRALCAFFTVYVCVSKLRMGILSEDNWNSRSYSYDVDSNFIPGTDLWLRSVV